MKYCFVVIGANYGDEGKGLITDALSRREEITLGCRFNGGAQAGHTVVDALSGRRHVFKHLSSSTFAGKQTYLSPDFIVNPYLLQQELSILPTGTPLPLIHPDARISTIYDMVLNSMAEVNRGQNRHGSCGVGINETVTRNDRNYKFVARDLLAGHEHRRRVFQQIHEEWFPSRAAELGIDISDPVFEDYMSAIKIGPYENLKRFDDLVMLLRGVITESSFPTKLIDDGKGLILEGAQGLGLDEDLGTFPFVTRSQTGLPQAIRALKSLNEFRYQSYVIRPVYVTRAYLTRHGAGPLEHEGCLIAEETSIEDKTNIPNPWQGSLRFGQIDVELLKQRITSDYNRAIALLGRDMYLIKPKLVVTCLDQVKGRMWLDGGRIQTDSASFPNVLAEMLNMPLYGLSYGPSANDVKGI